MPGPWDKYGGAAVAEPEQAGPWQKYAASNVVPIDRNSASPSQLKRAKHSLTGREAGKKSTSADVADLIEGTAKYSSGALLPAAVLAPGATILGAAGAAAAGYGGRKAATALGASEDQARLAGDVTGVAGGAVGARGAKAVGEVVSEVAPRLGKAANAVADRLPGVKWTKGTYAAARDALKAPQPSAPDPTRVVKASSYGARGERSPEDLGKLPGDLQATRGPLKAPVAVDASTNDGAASGMAKIMKTHGISHTEAASMTPMEWQLVASNAGLKQAPSPEVIQMAIAKLKQVK